MQRIYTTACASHCGGTCLMKVYVENGMITRIETDDEEEPQLRCCLRGRAYRQRVYAPDRILYPLKRVGPREKGEFKRISWDEALDLVAREMKRVKETYGPSAILLKPGGGDLTFVHGMGTIMERLLGLFGGYTGTWGSNSWEAAPGMPSTTLSRCTRSRPARTRCTRSRLWISAAPRRASTR